VDPDQLGRRRDTTGEPAKQVAGPAPYVEDALRRRHAREGKVRRPGGGLVVQPAEPSVLITSGTLVECCDVAVPGHALSLQLRRCRCRAGALPGLIWPRPSRLRR